MHKIGAMVLAVVVAAGECGRNGAEAGAADPGVPADFKLQIAVFGVRDTPLKTADVVVRKGRAYQFPQGDRLEVVLHDPATARLELFDLDRKLRSEITLEKLNAFQTKLHDAIAATCAKREAKAGKADKVAAAMSRDLIDPHFTATFDGQTHHLHLSNPTVDIDAFGEPETDSSRLALVASTLSAIAKLEALRDPKAMPPFSRLEALRALVEDHRLRPVGASFLYRLAGPPQKIRWTYRLVPALTAREIEALARVDRMRERCTFVRFERYEQAVSR